MATRFSGTAADRIRRLEERGRRCIAQSGHCVSAAVDEFDVIPIVDDRPDMNSPVTTVKTCGRHRAVVFADPSLHVVAHRRQVLVEHHQSAA